MLIKFLCLIIPVIIAARFPFIQNFDVTSADYKGGYLIVTGTMDVLFTDEAWGEFGYKDGNFYWFNEWWQDQIGSTYGPFKLVSVTWVLVEHTETHDKLGFEIVLTLRRGK